MKKIPLFPTRSIEKEKKREKQRKEKEKEKGRNKKRRKKRKWKWESKWTRKNGWKRRKQCEHEMSSNPWQLGYLENKIEFESQIPFLSQALESQPRYDPKTSPFWSIEIFQPYEFWKA